MQIDWTDDFVRDIGMPLQVIRREHPELEKSAGLCIVELGHAWTRAGFERAASFDFEPSRIARPAWETLQSMLAAGEFPENRHLRK